MKVFLKVIIFLFFTFMVVACYRPLPLDFYEADPPKLLVVNALLDAGDSVQVYVQRMSDVVKEDSNYYIDSAQVTLCDSRGREYHLVNKGHGFYGLDTLRPRAGLSYRVIVKYKDYPVAESDWVKVPYNPCVQFLGLDSNWSEAQLAPVWQWNADYQLYPHGRYLYRFRLSPGEKDTMYCEVYDFLSSLDSTEAFFSIATNKSLPLDRIVPITTDTLLEFAIFYPSSVPPSHVDTSKKIYLQIISYSRGMYFSIERDQALFPVVSYLNTGNLYSNFHNGFGVLAAWNDTAVGIPCRY